MAIASDLMTISCAHCEREIPTSNIDLHYVHCYRNLQKCGLCGEMVPKRLSNEHYHETHAPINCSLCSQLVEREAWALHKGENCPQRIVTCEYCEFPLPAIDLFKHQEICSNRTEYCSLCNKYVRLRERIDHENNHQELLRLPVAESSRNVQSSADREAAALNVAAAAAAADRRRHNHNASRGRLLLTIAVAGVAFVLGSFFFQRRGDSGHHQ